MRPGPSTKSDRGPGEGDGKVSVISPTTPVMESGEMHV